jgi:hypothetical protein
MAPDPYILGRDRAGYSRRLVLAALLALPSVVSLAGCDDPLFGKRKEPDPLLGAAIPKTVPDNQRAVTVTYPSAPAPSGGPTNAGLASNGTWAGRPGDNSGSGGIAPAGASSNGVSLQPPVLGGGSNLPPPPRATPTSSLPPAPSMGTGPTGGATGTGGAVRLRSFEHAQELLTGRGVRWQRLETVDSGEWRFSCSIPVPSNPNKTRTYEATDRYGLLAMQKVLDQISRDPR